MPGALCGDAGACLGSECKPICQVLGSGQLCNDGLACTTNDTCSGLTCLGQCPTPAVCTKNLTPFECAPLGACKTESQPFLTSCNGNSGECLNGQCLPKIPFTPFNIGPDIDAFAYPDGGWDVGLNCTLVIDTALNPVRSQDGGWCGITQPTVKVADLTTQDAGKVVILAMTGLTVHTNATVSFVGPLPVILVVLGDATIDGTLSAASSTATGVVGAGGNASSCDATNLGKAGQGKSGGGGGALGSAGGAGAGTDAGAGGLVASDVTEAPLRGGCTGGLGGSSAGGAGGGALQLTVAGTLTISGAVSASGGGGNAGPNAGGGGGGSGGVVFLHAMNLTVLGAVTAGGGGGGGGGGASNAGQDGLVTTAAAAVGGTGSQKGGAGGTTGAAAIGLPADPNTSSEQGGGGGGSSGYVFLRGESSCTKSSGAFTGVVKDTGRQCQ
jgi:hypothetical protein